jgi:hypothetical protein
MAVAPTASGDDDDDATSVDPPRKSDGGGDDEATKATGTPKKAREAQKLLEESRRMNAAGGPKPAKRLHPLVPIGVAIAIVAIMLLVLNAMLRSSQGAASGEEDPADQRRGIHRLFDW